MATSEKEKRVSARNQMDGKKKVGVKRKSVKSGYETTCGGIRRPTLSLSAIKGK